MVPIINIFCIQTINDSLHFLLNRPYSIDAVTMADKAIRNFNVRDLSFELLYGIPGQTEHMFMSDLERILYYEPEHVTNRPLVLQKGTPLYVQVKEGTVKAMP